MRHALRRGLAWAAGLVLALPALASLVVILSVAPVAGWLPPGAVEALRPLAAPIFAAIARLPPDSLPGQVFYGTFAPLPGLVGASALAVHAALLGLPWAALGAWVARRLARGPRVSGPRPPRAFPGRPGSPGRA